MFDLVNSFLDFSLSVATPRSRVKTILMVLFSLKEVAIKRLNGCDNGVHEVHLVHFHLLLGSLFLLFILVENSWSVAEPFIITLSVFSRRIMDRKEDLNQLLERNKIGVVMNLDHFSVAGCLATDFFVSRVLLVTSSIPGDDKADTI